jgi:hypothetical protein
MAGLDPAISISGAVPFEARIAGTSPAMTKAKQTISERELI